jgi:DNA-binding transcriptional ArsR family regulator
VYIFLLYANKHCARREPLFCRGWARIAQNIDDNTNVNVSIEVGEIRVEFSGSPDSVMRSAISFLAKQIPSIDLAKKISLNYAVSELIDIYASLIKITPEGPRVIPEHRSTEGKKLSDKEIIMLQLVASRIAKDLGKVQSDALQVSEICNSTSINPRSVSSRLSELVKAGHVSKESPKELADSVAYRITTLGIYWLNTSVGKKLV